MTNAYRIELLRTSPAMWRVYRKERAIGSFYDPDDAQLFVNARSFLDELRRGERLTITDAGRMLRQSTTQE